MANMFALILVIATLVTGVLWCLDKFIFGSKRRRSQPVVTPENDQPTKKHQKKQAGWKRERQYFRFWRLSW